MAQALAQSINTATVRVSEATGRARVAAVAQDFGISTPIAEGPAVALGVSEATLLEMTAAYAGFLNHGVSVAPYGLRSLRRKARRDADHGGRRRRRAGACSTTGRRASSSG